MQPRIIGRYAVYEEIAPGPAATTYFGRIMGVGGFTRVVAIHRVHPDLAADPAWVRMLLDEVRLVTRVRHPNVVPALDVVQDGGELLLVTEYSPGESLARLLAPLAMRGERIPPRIACGILAGVLRGLQAAHDTKSSRGEPLGIVHCAVSPHSILVGLDGLARLSDFGLGRAAAARGIVAHEYLAPEQSRGLVSARSDVYAAGIVLWEGLTGRKQMGVFEPPGRHVLGVPPEVDAIVMRAIELDPGRRWPSARDMAQMLEACIGGPATSDIGDWVERTARGVLAQRADVVSAIERDEAAHLPEPDRRATVARHDPIYPQQPSLPSELAGPSVTTAKTPRERSSILLYFLYALVGFLIVASAFVLLLLRRHR